MKDLPINGILFSSKDFEERAKEVLFVITPVISNCGVPVEDLIALSQLESESLETQSLPPDKPSDPVKVKR